MLSDVLYLDHNKNRTDTWLQGLGLQLPSDTSMYGSIGSITYTDGKVNIVGVPYSQLMQNHSGNAQGTIKYSLKPPDDGKRTAAMQYGLDAERQTKRDALAKMFVEASNQREADNSGLEARLERVYLEELQDASANADTYDSRDVRAIHDYMSSRVAYPLNAKLRSGAELSAEENALIERLDRAIVKAPKYKGTVYRSLSSRDMEDWGLFDTEHQPGRVVKYRAYTSISHEVYDASMDIQLIIESKNGHDISTFNKLEKEIIFERNTWFRVTKREGNTIWLIER